MSETGGVVESKFKIGDKVKRYNGDKVGTVVDVIIMSFPNGRENYFYKAEFAGEVLVYVPCDLQLYDEQETEYETNVGEN